MTTRSVWSERWRARISSTSAFGLRSRNLWPWWIGATQKSHAYGQPRLVSTMTYGRLTSGSEYDASGTRSHAGYGIWPKHLRGARK